MQIKKIQTFISLLLLILQFSCKDVSEQIEDNETYSSVLMTVKNFSDEDTVNVSLMGNTRSSLTPTWNGTSFSWNNGDIVGVYSASKGLTNFFIDEESISDNGTSATFNGSGFSLTTNSLYYAFYPYSPSALDKTRIPITYNGQTLKTNGSFSDLGSYDYMWARGETNTEGKIGFEFSHLGCVVEMKLEAPITATYKQVRFELEKSQDQVSLIKSGTVDLTSIEPIIYNENTSPSDTILRLSLNGDEGIKVEKDSILQVYMMMAPQDISSKNIIIRLIDSNNKWYTATTVGKNMKAGHTYHYYVGKNSSTGGFTGTGVGLPDDYEYKIISTYIHPYASRYEDILVEGNTIYAIGNFGIRKLSYANEKQPTLISENTNITDNYTRARSIALYDNLLYVNVRQNTWGENEIWKPQIRFDFENSISDESEKKLTNNSTINAFFLQFKVNRDLSKIHSATIYKAYPRSDGFRNAIVLRVNGENDIVFLGKTYSTKEEALGALTNEYTTNNGDYCMVNWSAISKESNDFTSLKFYTYYTKQTYISKSVNTYYDCTGSPSPNKGFSSAKFRTGDISTTSQVTLRNSINPITEGWFSFWINIPNTFSGILKCPLTYINSTCLSRINMLATNGGFKMYLNNSNSNNQIFKQGNWYNIKVHLSPSGSDLYFRDTECTGWTHLEKSPIPVQEFNTVSVGLSTDQSNTELLIDDFYFNESDIDKVSYVNGKVHILNKSDLSIINTINLDYRVTGLAIENQIMVVSGLYNIKFYDISTPSKPKLLYTYQPPFDRDMQGITTYHYGGRSYALVCCYYTGFMIWDITDKNNIHIACDEDFSDIMYKGLTIKKKLNCFSSVIQYPYAYLTISPIPAYATSYKEAAGLLKLNISDLSNISKELFFIPTTDITNNTSGDPSPTRIAKYGNTLFLNNRDNGIAIFDLVNDKPTYRENFKVGNSINPITIAPDGRLFTGDDGNVGLEKNLYLIRIE